MKRAPQQGIFRQRAFRQGGAGLAALLLLGGCMVGPNYHRPSAPMAASYKELAGWKPATPRDALDRGDWWAVFNDPLLDRLERRIDISNYTLTQAEANYRQAQALVQEAQAQLFPTITLPGQFQRTGVGGGSHAAVVSGNSLAVAGPSGYTINQYTLQALGSWTIDVWGEIRRQIEANVAAAQYSAAEVAAARLSAQATLAQDYFNLRAQDSLITLLEKTVEQYRKALAITENEYHAGYVARGDVLTAQTQLQTTEAQLTSEYVARADYEHAIAVLIGEPPERFSIPRGALPEEVPAVPPFVPSELLERRPDVAAAERQMAEANAEIGVAIGAWFPTISLSGFYGFTGTNLSTLFSAADRIWALGGAFDAPIFEGGAQIASVRAARAAYDAAVANYRQTVLTAFQQVEDALAALRILEEEKRQQDIAVKSAQENVAFALNEYKGGTVIYTTVLTDQELELSDEITDVTIQQNRLLAAVSLIEALGGGWRDSDLPTAGDLRSLKYYVNTPPAPILPLPPPGGAGGAAGGAAVVPVSGGAGAGSSADATSPPNAAAGAGKGP